MPSAQPRLRQSHLIGGVSNQPPEIRFPNQVEQAQNVVFDVARGASKRPNTEFVTAVTGCLRQQNYRTHLIDRDETEQYLVVYGDGVLNAYEIGVGWSTVSVTTAAQTYLDLNNADSDGLKMVTIADTTYIVNTTVPVAAKTSSDYAVTAQHRDYDVMIASTPADGTYHRATEGTTVQPSGYFQYDVDATFATYDMAVVSGSDWTDPTGFWNDNGKNPMGFEITIDATSYDVSVDMTTETISDMHDVAAALQRGLEDAGATGALISWAFTDEQEGRFTITSPQDGSSSTISAPTQNTDVYDLTAAGRPFEVDTTGDFTAGTGSASATPPSVHERWTRVAAPDQPTAELDAATMPVKMTRTVGSTVDSNGWTAVVNADSPFAFWKFTEPYTQPNEKIAVNAAGNPSLNGIYKEPDATYPITLNLAGATTETGNTAASFDQTAGIDTSYPYIDLPAMTGFHTNANTAGFTVEALVKTTASAAHIIDLRSAGSSSDDLLTVCVRLGEVIVEVESGDGAVAFQVSTTTTPISSGSFYHVVAVFDRTGPTVTIYVNGASQTVSTTSGSLAAQTYSAFTDGVIGAKYEDNDEITDSESDFDLTFNGTATLDSVVLYDAVLSGARVTAHYNAITATLNDTVAQFDVDVVDWAPRGNGDANSNPVPSLWLSGSRLADIAYHKNRLVLAGDENIVLSRAGDLTNFYLDDADEIVDADPIDLQLGEQQVTKIDWLQPFRQSLLIFTKAGRQFELNNPDVLSPTTAAVTPSTSYQTSGVVRPKILGSFVYFIGPRQTSPVVYEYRYDDLRADNAASEVNAHAWDLLPGVLRSIETSTNNRVLLAMGENDNDLYQYTFFFNGQQKEQSAWSQFKFDARRRISDIQIVDNDCYLLMENAETDQDASGRGAGGTSTVSGFIETAYSGLPGSPPSFYPDEDSETTTVSGTITSAPITFNTSQYQAGGGSPASGYVSWSPGSGLTEVGAQDGTATVARVSQGQFGSDWAVLQFDLTTGLPDDVVPQGMELKMRLAADSSDGTPPAMRVAELYLVDEGAAFNPENAIRSDDKSGDVSSIPIDDTFRDYTIGGSTDTWNSAFTFQELTSNTVRVAVRFEIDETSNTLAGFADIKLDYAELKLYYVNPSITIQPWITTSNAPGETSGYTKSVAARQYPEPVVGATIVPEFLRAEFNLDQIMAGMDDAQTVLGGTIRVWRAAGDDSVYDRDLHLIYGADSEITGVFDHDTQSAMIAGANPTVGSNLVLSQDTTNGPGAMVEYSFSFDSLTVGDVRGSDGVATVLYKMGSDTTAPSTPVIYAVSKMQLTFEVAPLAEGSEPDPDPVGVTPSFFLEKMPLLRDPVDTGMPFAVKLDSLHTLTGAYDTGTGLTTWTLPVEDETIDTVLYGPGFGEDLAGTPVSSNLTVSGDEVSAPGDFTEFPCVLGHQFDFILQPTRPFVRDRNGAADTNARFTTREINVRHIDTGSYTIKATQERRADRSKVFLDAAIDAHGETSAWFNGHAEDMTVTIEDTSIYPITITAVEFRGDHDPMDD